MAWREVIMVAMVENFSQVWWGCKGHQGHPSWSQVESLILTVPPFETKWMVVGIPIGCPFSGGFPAYFHRANC